jgi:cytochrome P450
MIDFDRLAEDLDPTSPEVVKDPYTAYATLRERCPVVHGSRFGGFWALTRFDDISMVEHDPRRFSSAQGVTVPDFGNTLPALPLEVDPPEHTMYRHLIQGFFSPGAMAKLSADIHGIARGLVSPLAGHDTADLAASLALPLPPIVIAHMMGLPDEDWPRFRNMSEAMLAAAAAEDSDANAEQAFELFSYIWAQIEHRRANPGDDLMSRIVQLEIDGRPLNDEETMGLTFLLVVAGHETTVGGIGFLLKHLAEYPDVQARVRADRSVSRSLIEESLRYEPPIQMFCRTVTEPTCLRGVDIDKGEKVLLLYGAANRDPTVFPDPDKFIPDRPNNRHLAFGAGPHRCAGAHLARVEMQSALDEVLDGLPPFVLDGEPDVYGGINRALHHLPVRFLR